MSENKDMIVEQQNTKLNKTRHFHRAFIEFEGRDAQRCLVRQANLTSDISEFHLIATQAVMLYPVINWLVNAQTLSDFSTMADNFKLNQTYSKNDNVPMREIKQVRKVQSTFNEILGKNPDKYFVKRNEFFKRCNTFLQVTSSSVNNVIYNSELIKKRSNGRCILGKSLLEGVISKDVSNHMMKTHFKEIIDGLVRVSGRDIIIAMMEIVEDSSPQNSEQAFLYHNFNVLFREYNRVKELIASEGITTKFVNGANGFILLIDTAIKFVRTFPKIGEDLYLVLTSTSSSDAAWKTDYDLAKEIGWTQSYYSVMRQKAFTVLGAVLWGCECNSLLTLFE